MSYEEGLRLVEKGQREEAEREKAALAKVAAADPQTQKMAVRENERPSVIEPQPDYREQFIDQVAIGLICRGRGHTDAWRVAEAAWDQRQVHKALKKP